MKMRKLMLISGLMMLNAISGLNPVHGQHLSLDTDSLMDLSLEELMNIEIVSASKKSENSFEAPLSSSVITKEEIINSGATSIEEVFRMIPGMIVREESNGNYDIHIRGNDNIPPGNYTLFSENTLTLVMIDDRKVYNYANGGVFWETLPISLSDIERIEVIRGPSAALYGPNAVSGVINIITGKAADKKIAVNGLAQMGNHSSKMVDMRISSSQLDNRLGLNLSANYEQRDRFQDTYYDWVTGQYTEADELYDYQSGSLSGNATMKYPDPGKSKERKGVNGSIRYDVNDKINFGLAGGWQNSMSQTVFMETTSTPLSNRSSTSGYYDFKSDFYGFNLNLSGNKGTQDIFVGGGSVTKYDFSTFDGNLEYDYTFGKVSVRPGISWQSANYSDNNYVNQSEDIYGYLNGSKTLSNFAYSLRVDYKVLENLRLIAALRMDHYNVPEKNYLTYQLIGTYELNENNLLRAVYSRANRGPFMMDTYSNFHLGGMPYIEYLGNKDIALPTMDMIEVGYRSKITRNFHLDVELFHTTTKDFTSFEPVYLDMDEYGLHLINQYVNLDVKSKQSGASLSLNWILSQKFQLKAFGTLQKTELINFDQMTSPIVIDPVNMIFELPKYETVNIPNKRTPRFYGGLIANAKPMDKLNINLNMYYMGNSFYRHQYAIYNEANGETAISPVVLLNTKVSYTLYKNTNLFVNIRNITNSNKEQFGFADKVNSLFMAGFQVGF
jgi:iron complex outermembrane recepter protein